MTPQFSVVVPLHNSQSTIRATLQSALVQQGVTFEILVIDDGSSDDGPRIVERVAARDGRVRLIRQEPSGVSEARNRGIAESRGELVAFLDADDLWAPSKLLRHAALHRARPATAASYSQIVFMPHEARSLAEGRTTSTIVPRAMQIADAIGDNPVCTASNLVARRDCLVELDGFATHWSHAEDQELVIRMIGAGHIVAGIDRVLTGYRLSSSGLSMNLEAMHQGWSQLADRYLEPGKRPAAEALYLRYLARRALRSGNGAIAPAQLALAGLRCDSSAFLADRRRGWSTLAAALVAPTMPSAMRRYLFA